MADVAPSWHPALAGVRLLLVDFDGPLARLLPDPEHLRLAEGLATWYAERTGRAWDAAATDHVQVLREIHARVPALVSEAEALATEWELTAAAGRTAYPDAIAVLRRWQAGAGRVAVVSNNAETAVRRVLAPTALGPDGPPPAYTIHGRRPDALAQLKPRPDLLLQAMAAHRATPAGTVMIGDTTSDVAAGQAAGVRTIGIAETPDRARELHAAGAIEVLARLADL